MRRLTTSALAVVLVTSIPACGSDPSASADRAADPVTTLAPSTTPAATTAAPTTTQAAIEVDEVDIGLADYSFQGLPETLPSGPTRLLGTNTGTEEHQATFVRINDDQTLGILLAALAAAPQSGYPLVSFAGGPQSVDGAPVPAGDSIVLTNFAFGLPDQIEGPATTRVVNNGDQPHEVAAYRVNDGIDPQEALVALTSATPTGPPPVTPAGGIAPIQPGTVAGIDADWAPGDYVLVCFLPDATDGIPHFTKGMATKVTVSG